MKDYSKLKALLEEQETFPHLFTYKFIGRNTPAFEAAVQGLLGAHPGMRGIATRESSGGNHSARTCEYEASSADDVIRIFRAIEKLDDLVLVL